MSGLPLLLDVTGRRVVVAGGGPVAARRVRAFVDAGAEVDVVTPFACEEIVTLNDSQALSLHLREFVDTDLNDAWLVCTATGDKDVDGLVSAGAEARRLWCLRADDAQAATAWMPAVARLGDVVVAVNAGGDPKRATRLRDAVATGLDTGALPLRRVRPGAGQVALIGGGPGDPGLITTRGRALLAQADVVIVDRLGPRALLDELDEDVEVIDAGKAPHAHTLTQDQINALLVERAQQGQRVVRLKGGDPFVLGRGAEEVAACEAAGVDVTVVPGVTSAISVPGLAGIPVTHRGVTSRFTVVSGHDGPLDFSNLASTDGTLLFLMGVSRLAEITHELIQHGRDGAEPVAIIERGATPQQRVTTGTLTTIAERALLREVSSPAVIVVGAVAGLRTGPDDA